MEAWLYFLTEIYAIEGHFQQRRTVGAGGLMKLIFRALHPPGETKSSKQQ